MVATGMQLTLLAYRHLRQGLVIRPLLALCLVLAPAAPAQAGWLKTIFGSRDAKPSASPAPATALADASISPSVDTTDPLVAIDSLSEGASDVAASDLAEEEVVTILPSEEESPADEEDLALEILNPEDLAEAGNLWDRTRAGFKLDLSQDNERIAAQRNWYTQHQAHLDRVAVRASRYLHYTVSEAQQRGLPTELALLPIIESSYDPFANSHASASGMWQFIPGTGKIFGLKQNGWFDGRRDVVESTRAAYDFLTQLYNKFGSWELALAAYNAGPGAVQRAINRNIANGLPADFWSLRLPSETMSYVPRFLAVAQVINSPESHGLNLVPVADQPHFRAVETSGQVDLTAAASLAGISLKELLQLNPGFSRWATDPEGPHRLLVPASLPVDFEQQIASLPAPEQVLVEHYRVKRGDNLFKIAKRFGLSPAELKRMNKLKSNRVAVGGMLVVAHARGGSEAYDQVREQLFGKRKAASSTVAVRYYKVRRGDTLSSVARKHGITAKQLARLNGLKTKSHLRLGQRLSIKAASKSDRSSRVASRSGSKSKAKRISYEVRKGDTLFSIGKRYNVSVKQIKNWNGASRNIRPGQDLVIYVASSGYNRQGSL